MNSVHDIVDHLKIFYGSVPEGQCQFRLCTLVINNVLSNTHTAMFPARDKRGSWIQKNPLFSAPPNCSVIVSWPHAPSAPGPCTTRWPLRQTLGGNRTDGHAPSSTDSAFCVYASPSRNDYACVASTLGSPYSDSGTVLRPLNVLTGSNADDPTKI